MGEQRFISLGEAQKILGVSHTTMARLVKEGRFAIYRNPLDRRQKLVDVREIRAAAAPVAMKVTSTAESDGTPQPEPPPAPPTDDPDFQRAFHVLAFLAGANDSHPDTTFVQTQSGDVHHPGIDGGKVGVPIEDFNRLRMEGYLRVLPNVYHRVGSEMGREFIITQDGYDLLRNSQ